MRDTGERGPVRRAAEPPHKIVDGGLAAPIPLLPEPVKDLDGGKIPLLFENLLDLLLERRGGARTSDASALDLARSSTTLIGISWAMRVTVRLETPVCRATWRGSCQI